MCPWSVFLLCSRNRLTPQNYPTRMELTSCLVPTINPHFWAECSSKKSSPFHTKQFLVFVFTLDTLLFVKESYPGQLLIVLPIIVISVWHIGLSHFEFELTVNRKEKVVDRHLQSFIGIPGIAHRSKEAGVG